MNKNRRSRDTRQTERGFIYRFAAFSNIELLYYWIFKTALSSSTSSSSLVGKSENWSWIYCKYFYNIFSKLYREICWYIYMCKEWSKGSERVGAGGGIIQLFINTHMFKYSLIKDSYYSFHENVTFDREIDEIQRKY